VGERRGQAVERLAEHVLHRQEGRATVLTHVERLVGAGGAVVEERKGDMGERWVVMTDPEGNEFCVCAVPDLSEQTAPSGQTR
jgi:hypothetical protein